MKWTDIKTTVTKQYAEAAEAIVTSISGGGIYIEDYSDLEAQVEEIAHVDLIEQDLIEKDRNCVIIHYYVSPDENFAEVVELMKERFLAAEVPYTMELVGVEQEDWESGWKAFYHPMDIGNRLAICPSWEHYETERVVMQLDPGMAFGTGTHETTSLCLSVLDREIKGGERMLDIGTGSGILAIGALLLGAAHADGVDIDPMCVRTATENATLNGVADRFQVLVGNLSDKATGKYDIICANIVANAIINLTPAVPALLVPNGLYITSGIIDTREEEVVAAIKANGFSIKEILHDKGWVCIIAR
ncbi:MAG: 50S ribosomal protein L11 methyltransferase [Oscillospiraceae bacterium]|nr:50S ribosomal protein L11 methyltransferase [Oscillospiraceae bacterium]